MHELRDQILDAVEQRLSTIAISAGYRTNVGQRVLLRSGDGVPKKEFPALVIRPGRSPVSNVAGGKIVHELNVGLICLDLDKDERGAIDKAYAIARDALQAVGKDSCWGGLARRTALVDTDEETELGDLWAGAVTVSLVIEYESGLWTF